MSAAYEAEVGEEGGAGREDGPRSRSKGGNERRKFSAVSGVRKISNGNALRAPALNHLQNLPTYSRVDSSTHVLASMYYELVCTRCIT